MFQVHAQDYMISFAATGDTTVVSIVKVYNLTSGDSVTLNSGDILRLTPFVGIGNLIKHNETLQLYPNPMEGQAFLTFFAPANGDALIRVVDFSGKTVYQTSKLLSIGTHSFRISNMKQGIYFLEVTSENYHYATKLICLNNQPGKSSIEYVSSIKKTTENQFKNVEATIDMLYKEGDRLLFKSSSGRYNTIVTDVPSGSKKITFNFVLCTDADNNNYSTVAIGTQVWMAENLKTTKYNDGTSIPEVTGTSAWALLLTPGFGWYNNDIANKNTYGALYNWFTVNTGKLAPAGWHVPSEAEWNALITFLGGENVAGGELKEVDTVYWASPNTGATNSKGFSALPGGYHYVDGYYKNLGRYASFWSTTLFTSMSDAWALSLGYNYAYVDRYWARLQQGYSIRCVKD
jgi:uncharacterized protein (TIGR02145 family)